MSLINKVIKYNIAPFAHGLFFFSVLKSQFENKTIGKRESNKDLQIKNMNTILLTLKEKIILQTKVRTGILDNLVFF